MNNKITEITKLIDEKFNGCLFLTDPYFTDDCDTIYRLDVKHDEVHFSQLISDECRCCTTTEDCSLGFNEFMENLSENDLEQLMNCLILESRSTANNIK